MFSASHEPYSQEQLQAALNRHFSTIQGREVIITILGTQRVQNTGFPEWQSRIRYKNQEGQTIEREVRFVMEEGMPCVQEVTEARLVSIN